MHHLDYTVLHDKGGFPTLRRTTAAARSETLATQCRGYGLKMPVQYRLLREGAGGMGASGMGGGDTNPRVGWLAGHRYFSGCNLSLFRNCFCAGFPGGLCICRIEAQLEWR